MTKVPQFRLDIGFNEGYGHDNEFKVDIVWVTAWYQKIARDVFLETGVYVAGVVHLTATVYNDDWGCPKGGEQTASVSGLANPHYIQDVEAWKDAVRLLCQRMRKQFKQTTAYLTFQEVEFEYLRDETNKPTAR